jgi:glycerol-3-phosphate dehydrogenase
MKNRPEGAPLKDKFEKAYEYSDCWVEDSRLVSLNARDAAERGAEILTRTQVTAAERVDDHWEVTLRDTGTGATETRRARMIVNAGGPWVGELIGGVLRLNTPDRVRLVRGSHIVTRKLFDHEKCYFFQGTDGRIIFAIPYETDYTLIGTTDQAHEDADARPEITAAETDYLLDFASHYFKEPVTRDDIVWTYSGVRPLYDDGAKSATAATRDYVLKVEQGGGAPILNVFGGKITTYRRLAEGALEKIAPFFPGTPAAWTAGVPLPGGDFPVKGVETLIGTLRTDHPFLTDRWARRLVRAYGTEAREILGDAATEEDLGEAFGATLTAAEVDWLMRKEFARTAEDVLWRRSKLGLRLDPEAVARLDAWMAERRPRLAEAAE